MLQQSRLTTYLSFVRFSHSVFALPFALTGALLAIHPSAALSGSEIGWRALWIVVAMVAARSAAMGVQPPRRREVGRQQPAHGHARAAARRHEPA